MNCIRLPPRFLGVEMSVTMPRLMLLACLLSPSFLWPSSAWALGLGEIHLNSALNEPMNAEIDLIAATSDELTALRASLAGRDAFTRYGIDRPPFLSRRPGRYAHQDRAQLARECAGEAGGHRSNHAGGVSRQSRCVWREHQHFA